VTFTEKVENTSGRLAQNVLIHLTEREKMDAFILSLVGHMKRERSSTAGFRSLQQNVRRYEMGLVFPQLRESYSASVLSFSCLTVTIFG